MDKFRRFLGFREEFLHIVHQNLQSQHRTSFPQVYCGSGSMNLPQFYCGSEINVCFDSNMAEKLQKFSQKLDYYNFHQNNIKNS